VKGSLLRRGITLKLKWALCAALDRRGLTVAGDRFDMSRITQAFGSENKSGDRAIVTVLGVDQIGIVAAVATALAECGVNILDISQTLFGDLFSMNMLVSLSGRKDELNTLKARLDRIGEDMGLRILIQREDVFRFMHRV
jgi:ACT domain-containing protein